MYNTKKGHETEQDSNETYTREQKGDAEIYYAPHRIVEAPKYHQANKKRP